ncbi:uncharacterized protein LOC124539072 [Vanessa cardui]|uniref:uncharacterized protein LOC124539072 n=1 Tax=Vanessa cardui TaxID=171605 RepID=UPI001F13D761|nr:uncharacterized protein LOC124539072 [Vanessa cardui]
MEDNNQALPQAFASTPEVSSIALSMRIPPFWRENPRLWYLSFEAATEELKRTQAQLTQMVLVQLEKADIEQISDILFNVPKEQQYQAIKERLISVYEESDSRQFQKLLAEMELGDQKPTQLLRRMRHLARDKVSDSTLRMMWTKLLPAHVRSVLAVSETFSSKTTLEELALLADKMMEQTQEVAAVSTQPSTIQSPMLSTNQTDTQFLINEIRKLSLEIAELKARPNTRPPYNYHRQRFRSRQRSSSRSRTCEESSSPYCYYHRRSGSQARRCTTPCSYKKEASEN